MSEDRSEAKARSDQKKPKSRCAFLLAAVVAIVVAGCGGSTSDSDKAKSTVTEFFEAVANGKGDTACALLTDSAIKELNSAAFLLRAPASCAEAIETFNRQLSSDDKKSLKSAKVNRVTVTGDRATVADNDIVLTSGGEAGLFRNNDPRPVALEKIGSDWKISSLG
ncbi:MAG: hypothetical protein ACR2HV_07515 [Acidimicrobiales bacterium]